MIKIILVLIINVTTILGISTKVGGETEKAESDNESIVIEQSIGYKHNTSNRIVAEVGKRSELPKTLESSDCKGIKKRFLEVGSPLSKRQIEFVCRESEKRGLNSRVVLAILAYESSYGKSTYCRKYFNCWGFGANEGGSKTKIYFQNKNFEEGTVKILNQFKKKGYGKTTQSTKDKGYNQRQSWVTNINLIIKQFGH